MTTKTCFTKCQADCTFGDGVCHRECNGINGCVFREVCDGVGKGAVVCFDEYSTVTCCSGTPTTCGTVSITCPKKCDGNRLCSYPSNQATCSKTCSGGVCQECVPDCGTPSCTDCGAGYYCSIDTCVSCPAGWANCDGSAANKCETSLLTDPSNCGSCGNICPSTAPVCENGKCIPSATPACSSDADCNDKNPCTTDVCKNPGTPTASCVHTIITACTSGDGCCPEGCSYLVDTDCPVVVKCGNGKCETGEDCCNCPEDCSAGTCLGDVPGEVCKKYICSGKTKVEVYKENCCGNRICESGEGCWSCPADCSCPAGQQCLYDKCTTKKLLPNGAECTSNEECSSGHCEFGYCCAAGLCCRQDSECPRGQVCVDYSCQLPGTKCSDGTPTGQCSNEKPKYCNNGVWVYACATCGCPEGEICRMDGLCYGLQCSDGTQQGKCSSNKPLFCSKNRELIEKCSECGCPEGFLCDREREFCYKKPSLKILSPLENHTINVGVERKVVISGVVVKDEKPVAFSIEGNDSRFLLASYDATTGEFVFENVTPIEEGYNYFCVRIADNDGNLLAKEERSFKIINAPPGITDLFSLQELPFGIVQLSLLFLFLFLLLNVLIPLIRKLTAAPLDFPDGSIVLVEGAVGSGKEEFCFEVVRRKIREGKFSVILSYDPAKEENWFSTWERNRLLFIKIEPDINEIAISISKMLGGEPRMAFINILSLLLTKYNAEELSDFLSTNFTKLRNAKCSAVFCVDKGVNDETLSAVEGLFDGVVEFQVQEEKGKLSSYFRVKEFKTKKFDSNWRRFK
ncbi:MAG: hypothetical protein QXF56_00600 [Candidatus Micrarchaeia archaeon]